MSDGVINLSKVSIIIAEDQSLIRDGLAAILDMEDNYTVVARTSDGLAAIEQVRIHQPQLLLIDIHMPVLNGLEAGKQILTEFPQTKVLFLTTFEDEEYMIEALRIGAAGFLIKGMHTDSILATIEECLAGRISYPASIQAHLIQALQQSNSLELLPQQTNAESSLEMKANQADTEQLQLALWNKLTEQERKIASKLKQGKSNQVIAQELFLTTGTVKNYLYSIYKKLGVNSRSEAIAFLYNYDL